MREEIKTFIEASTSQTLKNRQSGKFIKKAKKGLKEARHKDY